MKFHKYNSMLQEYKQKEINFWLSIYPELINEPFIITEKLHGCLDYNTEIETLEFGKLSIGKIVEEKIKCHVKSFNFELNEIIYEPIINWFINDNDSEWYLIELEDGTKIKITENHYVWLPELKCFRQTKELKTNDLILFDK